MIGLEDFFMDAAAREVGPVFVELREIRGTLKRALNSAENLEQKFTGPRPASPESLNKNTTESMRSMIGEILNLSARLEKTIESHHAIFGDTSDSAPLQTARFA